LRRKFTNLLSPSQALSLPDAQAADLLNVFLFHVSFYTGYDFVHGWRVDESCGAYLDGGGSGKKVLQSIVGAGSASFNVSSS